MRYLALVALLALAIPAAAEPSGGGGSRSDSNSNGSGSGGSSDEGELSTSLAGLVVLGGAVTTSAYAIGKDSAQREQALAQLGRFLERHHVVVTRDVVRGQGPVLDGWLAGCGLRADEVARFRARLEGSAEQTAMLEATAAKGRTPAVFADAFARVLEASVSPTRFRQVVTALSPG